MNDRGNLRCVFLVVIGFVQVVMLGIAPAQSRFEYERYSAENGALYMSSGFATNEDSNVTAVLVDSRGRVWVGTVTGLALYDGKRWAKRTFDVDVSPPARLVLSALQVSHCGPGRIVEGPPGTVWFGGRCGVWRFRDDRYELIGSVSEIGYVNGMAASRDGTFWVTVKERAQKYDGQTWSTVLCPYIGKPKSIEAPGMHGVVVDTNGDVWIGATVYGKPTAPWEHDGPVWVVDQEHLKRNEGPPMAPLFEFNGRSWKAFGPLDGFDAEWAVPELNGDQVGARTSSGWYVNEGDKWRKSEKEVDLGLGKRWFLRKRGTGYSDLLFRDGENLIQVRPTDHKTGEVLDLKSEQLALLCMAEDRNNACVWLGTTHGLYRIWCEAPDNGSKEQEEP